MIGEKRSDLVLAIRPFTCGFAFVLFEAPLSPIDWGTKEIRGAKWNARCLAAARSLIERTKPAVVVLPDHSATPAREPERIKRLHRLLANYTDGESIELCRYTRAHIRECFAGVGAVTRYEIAQAIAAQVHAFGHRLPRVRRIWDPEDPRMYLFDAAALVMTHYSSPRSRPPENE